MQDYRQLRVWQRSHQVVLDVYAATKRFPRDEIFQLTSQIRRSAYSVPSNIAEGCGRGTDADFGRFLSIASGSASELDYQLLLARDLTYLDPAAHETLSTGLGEARRMLGALIQTVAR